LAFRLLRLRNIANSIARQKSYWQQGVLDYTVVLADLRDFATGYVENRSKKVTFIVLGDELGLEQGAFLLSFLCL